MLDLQPVSIEHRSLFDEKMLAENAGASCTSFGNIFLWDLYCKRNIATAGDRMIIEFLCPNGPFYAFPIGRGDIAPAVEALREDAAFKGRPLTMKGVTREQCRALEDAFPGCWSFEDDRDNWDYVYSLESMASLAGKRLHGKRNHCNRFESSHSWSFTLLTPDRFDDCRILMKQWDAEKGANAEECRAVDKLFSLWERMGMTGGVLYAEGSPIAFTVGEKITADTVDVHFEKAHDDVPGAYPMIAREYARFLLQSDPDLRYVNREEDMGIPGLRKAKEDWYPERMIEVSVARWKEAL